MPSGAAIVTAYTDGEVTLRSNRAKIGYHEAADLSGFQGVEPGDFVVHGLDIMRGSVGVSDSQGAISAVCTVCAPAPDVDPRFMAYAIRAQAQQGYPKALARGVREGGADFRRWDTLAELLLPNPPFEDQRRIADFLDQQVALLDSAVALRRKQMALLDERARAREYSAVLGLDEPGSRHSVSTEWIGDVPAGWTVQPLGRLFSIELGKMLAPDRIVGDHLRPYLRNTNVQWDRIEVHDLLTMNFPPEERARYEVLPGDLLVCEGGESGRAAIWDGAVSEIYYQKALHRLRPKTPVSARWVYYVLRVTTHLGVFAASGGGTTIAHLTGEQLKAHRMPFAPLHVQERLVRELDAANASENCLRSLHDRQLALLSERKDALITSAVTGQFDVRTARSVA